MNATERWGLPPNSDSINLLNQAAKMTTAKIAECAELAGRAGRADIAGLFWRLVDLDRKQARAMAALRVRAMRRIT